MKIRGMKGMTVMELVLVLGIACIVSGFAFWSSDMVRRERVHAAARELYSDIQKVRVDAMTGAGKGYGVRFESPDSYVMFEFEDCNGDYTYDAATCAGGAPEEKEPRRKTLPPGIALVKTSGATVNNDVRIFDSFGSPRQANWGMGPITILVKNSRDSGETRCISISLNRIRESVWNGTECI